MYQQFLQNLQYLSNFPQLAAHPATPPLQYKSQAFGTIPMTPISSHKEHCLHCSLHGVLKNEIVIMAVENLMHISTAMPLAMKTYLVSAAIYRLTCATNA